MDGDMHKGLLACEKKEVDNLKERVVDESKKIWKVAFPGILAGICSFGTIVVTQSIIGHISKKDLAGYALVQTLIVKFMNGILIGMSSATETLSGQAYGAGQYHMMGVYLQRSWIVDLVSLTLFLPVFVFGTFIFKLLGQKEDIAEAAGYISLWFIPFVYSYVFSLTIQMYLQAQQKNMIIAWLSVLQFVIHVPLSWLFVIKFNWDVGGAIAALNISAWISVIGQFVYIFGGWCPHTWNQRRTQVVGLELWYYAILVLLAGYVKDAEVAIDAFSICLNIHNCDFMISLGFLGAASVRVANELGRGDAKATKFSIKVLLSTSVAIGVVCFLLVLVFGDRLGYLFSNEKDVVERVSGLSLPLALSILLNSVYPVLTGVTVGAGLQKVVAIINICCFYLIGIPVGAFLGYVTNLQVKGIWIGLIFGVLAETLALCYMTRKTNWDKEVDKTSDRLRQWYLKSPEEYEETSYHT